MAKQYHYPNAGITGYNGKDLIKIPKGNGTSTETRHVFEHILNNLEFKLLDDSIQGTRLANAIDEAEGQDEFVIGEGVFDWLKKKLDEVSREGYQMLAVIFRVNGEFVHEFIKSGFDKPHQSKEKKAGKEKADAPPAE